MIDSSTMGYTDATGLVFRLLGPLAITGPAGVVRIPPGRQEVILAALLLEVNRVVSTEYLVDLIWAEDPPETARTQVQICVSRLRKSLTAARIDTPITTTPPGYLLQAPDELVDLTVFNRQLAQSRGLQKEGRSAQAAELLRRASGLWRGPTLGGIPSEALRTKAQRLDEERLIAIETYLELELDLGHHHQLVGEIGQLVNEHPLRERLRAQLMIALYRSGRQAEALASYRAGRDMLISELGLEPSESLRLLETAILSGDPALQPAPQPVHASGPDPDPVIAAAPEPTPIPASDALTPPYRHEKPHQLPADTADFVEDPALTTAVEVALAGADASRAVGVVVIVGRPGVGKSTTATHIAHLLGDEHFPDGQLYCDLRGTGSASISPADALGRFLRALGIPGPMIPESLDERGEMYRNLLAKRRVLVVLDDAAAESQIAPLLPGGGSCAVLITSRVPLTGLPGITRIEVDVLDQPRAMELLARVVGRERVNGEREAAADLIRTVGALPLALRIVAARLAARPHWSLASMVDRLANERYRLDEIAHGEMTMRATLSLTYDGLSRPDRLLLRLLSLSQGVTLPGWLAGALLDDHRQRPSDLLEPLVDVQMLDVVAIEVTGEFRYRFHEIIRLFAREQLTALDEPAVRDSATRRMIGGWLAIAEEAHRRIYGGDFTILHSTAARWQPPPERVAGMLANPLDWMDREQANLCSAVEQAAAAQLDDLCWDLTTTLVTLFEARGYLDQWEQTHQRALEAVRQAGNKRGTAALLGSLGTLYMSRSQPIKSRDALESSLAIFAELDDRHGLALGRRDLALLERQRGDDDLALVLYEQAIGDFETVGDIVGKATALTQCSHIWMRRGDITKAHAQLEEALEIYRSVGYVGGQAHALRRVGQILLQRGEHDEAQRTLTAVLAMVRDIGDVVGEGHLLRNLGEVSIVGGRVEEAREFFHQALAVREQIMDHGGAAVVRLDLARLLVLQQDPASVGDLLAEAIAVFRHRQMLPELREAEQLRGAASAAAPAVCAC